IAFPLGESDALVAVHAATGEEDILMVTAGGRALRFPQADVRPMGRNASGVKGIDLEPGDVTAAMDLCRSPEDELLVVSAQGRAKRAALAEFPLQGRAGKGVATIPRGDTVACARTVSEGDLALFLTTAGMVLRQPVSEIPRLGRSARGSPLPLTKGDRVTSLLAVPGDTAPLRPKPPAAQERPTGTARKAVRRKETRDTTAAKVPGKTKGAVSPAGDAQGGKPSTAQEPAGRQATKSTRTAASRARRVGEGASTEADTEPTQISPARSKTAATGPATGRGKVSTSATSDQLAAEPPLSRRSPGQPPAGSTPAGKRKK
ncbi:MAG: DNA gyrase C-terminal beta-propeller domain-containing protein, partial [Chloroflexia bacterium]